MNAHTTLAVNPAAAGVIPVLNIKVKRMRVTCKIFTLSCRLV